MKNFPKGTMPSSELDQTNTQDVKVGPNTASSVIIKTRDTVNQQIDSKSIIEQVDSLIGKILPGTKYEVLDIGKRVTLGGIDIQQVRVIHIDKKGYRSDRSENILVDPNTFQVLHLEISEIMNDDMIPDIGNEFIDIGNEFIIGDKKLQQVTMKASWLDDFGYSSHSSNEPCKILISSDTLEPFRIPEIPGFITSIGSESSFANKKICKVTNRTRACFFPMSGEYLIYADEGVLVTLPGTSDAIVDIKETITIAGKKVQLINTSGIPGTFYVDPIAIEPITIANTNAKITHIHNERYFFGNREVCEVYTDKGNRQSIYIYTDTFEPVLIPGFENGIIDTTKKIILGEKPLIQLLIPAPGSGRLFKKEKKVFVYSDTLQVVTVSGTQDEITEIQNEFTIGDKVVCLVTIMNGKQIIIYSDTLEPVTL